MITVAVAVAVAMEITAFRNATPCNFVHTYRLLEEVYFCQNTRHYMPDGSNIHRVKMRRVGEHQDYEE